MSARTQPVMLSLLHVHFDPCLLYNYDYVSWKDPEDGEKQRWSISRCIAHILPLGGWKDMLQDLKFHFSVRDAPKKANNGGCSSRRKKHVRGADVITENTGQQLKLTLVDSPAERKQEINS